MVHGDRNARIGAQMTRALLIIAAVTLAGCVKPADLLQLAPTPAQLCAMPIKAQAALAESLGSDVASMALACLVVR